MRVPSMLIRRDALLSASHGFENLLAAHPTAHLPTAGQTLNPQQQWEAMQKQRIEIGKAELMKKLTQDTDDEGVHRIAEKWLNV
jgi:hypothetical protein